MFLKSINKLHRLVEQTDLYKSKIKRSDRELLIDKSNLIIDTIVRGNRHCYGIQDYEPVNLNNEILRTQLGTNYKEILCMLIDLDIIQTDNSYMSTSIAKRLTSTTNRTYFAKSKSYGLTDSAKKMDIKNVGVLNERTIKRINKHRINIIKSYLKDNEIHAKIIYNTTNLYFNLTDEEQALGNIIIDNDTQFNHLSQIFKDLLNLNTLKTTDDLMRSNNYFYNANNKVGRVYHYYTTIPKYFRKQLRHTDGTKLAEIDLRNSQPLILGLIFRQAILNEATPNFLINNTYINTSVLKWFDANKTKLVDVNPTVIRELDALLKELFEGTFYKTIQNKATELGVSLGANIDEIKKEILKTFYKINSKVGPGECQDPTCELTTEDVISSIFPNFIKFIRRIKSERHYKELSHIAQIYESQIFINRTFPNLKHAKDFAVPIHDSLIVKVTEIDYYKDLLINSFTSVFNVDREIASYLLKVEYYE